MIIEEEESKKKSLKCKFYTKKKIKKKKFYSKIKFKIQNRFVFNLFFFNFLFCVAGKLLLKKIMFS